MRIPPRTPLGGPHGCMRSIHRTVPKTKGWRWFKVIWNGFFRSRERKEENPRNYYSLRARERKNTFLFTFNQRQHLTFGTVSKRIDIT